MIAKESAKTRPGLLKSVRMQSAVAKEMTEPLRRQRTRVAQKTVDDRAEQMPGYYLG